MAVWVYLLDLVDDEGMISEYESWHRTVWPEVLTHLKASGIEGCQILRAGNRLVMLVESEKPTPPDGGGAPIPERVVEWEALMGRYQLRLPWALDNEKWVLAHPIFSWKP